MSKKKYISRRNQKNIEHHYWIIHIQISLSTNFQLKLTVAIFPQRVAIFSLKQIE